MTGALIILLVNTRIQKDAVTVEKEHPMSVVNMPDPNALRLIAKFRRLPLWAQDPMANLIEALVDAFAVATVEEHDEVMRHLRALAEMPMADADARLVALEAVITVAEQVIANHPPAQPHGGPPHAD